MQRKSINSTVCCVLDAERPVELVEPLKEVRVVEHDKATLSCKLSKPNKKVTWLKNGVELSPTETPRWSVVSDGCEYTLTLDDCNLDDTAQYSMRCEDVETSTTLTVDGTWSPTYPSSFSRSRDIVGVEPQNLKWVGHVNLTTPLLRVICRQYAET